MAAVTYTKTGTKSVTAAKLDKDIFGISEIDQELLKKAYVAYLANGRLNLAVTKTRGLVRGGGKKPWRQKGTGRARFGSTRNPIWRSGGIAFGPTGNENYKHVLPTNLKRKAIKHALSIANTEGRINIIESFDFKDGKVKSVTDLLGKLNISGTVLIVVMNKDSIVDRSTRNLPKIKAVQATYLNVFDLVNADVILIDKDGLASVHKWLEGVK